MGISDRIEGSIEKWRKKWGEALKAFLVNVLSFGIEVFFNILGKAFAPKLKPLIDSLEATGKVPPELQPILDEMKAPSGEVASIFATSAGYALVGGAVGKLLDAILLPLAYAVSAGTRNVILTEPQILASWLREDMAPEQANEFLKWLGHEEVDIDWLKKLVSVRLDPASISRVWLRDKEKYEKYWGDLRHQGWSKDRIEVAKELAKVYPPLSDMIRFADFGGFDPAIIEEWREMYDAPSFITEPMSKIGLTNEAPWEWANRYWFSHWTQPGRYELNEMFRRGILSGKDYPSGRVMTPAEIAEGERITKLTYFTQGFSPYWQDKLVGLLRELPTRVDVRRWWDMRTITEGRLRELYQAQGYFDQDLEDYVLWTKVYVAFPDLIARFKNGWITEDDVRSELVALGMPADRVEEMIQTKVKPMQPAQVEEERKATATEIMKGVKKGLIDRGTGITMLGELGYSVETAEFKLDVYLGVSTGSPESFIEFKRMTQLYRKAVGLNSQVPPDDLVEAGKAVKQAEVALREAEIAQIGEEKLAEYLGTLKDAEYRYRQLLISWEENIKK